MDGLRQGLEDLVGTDEGRTGRQSRDTVQKMISRELRRKHEQAGREWFRSLTSEQKFDLGDAFVLDTFDWTDWFETKPGPGFLSGAERERLFWELTGD